MKVMVVTVQFNVMVLLVTVGVLMVKEISWLRLKSDLTDQTALKVRHDNHMICH